jgi:hypothetical protein
MKTRNGKIARLPLEIREQLNSRLADGEPANQLVEWLNSNPAVMKVIQQQFDGRPITEQNMSEWHSGGYEEWLLLRSFFDEARVLSENAGEVADTGIKSEHLYMVLLAHHAHLVQNFGIMPDLEMSKKAETLKKLTASIMNMRRSEQNAARLQLQRERLELLREIHAAKSASSSKSAASISGAATPSASQTRQPAQPCASPFAPSIPSTADLPNPEDAAPPLSAPAAKSAPKVPPLSGRIQSDFSVSPDHRGVPAPSDRLGFILAQPSKLAA